jgi:hypothetical protein
MTPSPASSKTSTSPSEGRPASRAGSVGGRSPEKPLPWNERASEAAEHLSVIRIGWACVLVASVHTLQGPTCGTCTHPSCMYAELGREPHRDPASVAKWLHRHAGALSTHPAGPDAVEEILTTARRARHARDAPPQDIYAGPCDDCDGDLYARPGAVTVTCRWCTVRGSQAARPRRQRCRRSRSTTATTTASTRAEMNRTSSQPNPSTCPPFQP